MRASFFKILAAFVLLFLCSFKLELPNIHVKNQAYEILYSQDFQQPLTVKYKILCNSKSSQYFSRKGLDFYKTPDIITSDNLDYAHNVYDKGHMAPAAAFNCNQENLKLTFSYVNCAMQHKDLNRGPWKELESYERELSLTNNVDVLIILDFTGSYKNSTGVMIPVGFFKILSLNGKKFKSYYFPNQSTAQYFENFLIKKF